MEGIKEKIEKGFNYLQSWDYEIARKIGYELLQSIDSIQSYEEKDSLYLSAIYLLIGGSYHQEFNIISDQAKENSRLAGIIQTIDDFYQKAEQYFVSITLIISRLRFFLDKKEFNWTIKYWKKHQHSISLYDFISNCVGCPNYEDFKKEYINDILEHPDLIHFISIEEKKSIF